MYKTKEERNAYARAAYAKKAPEIRAALAAKQRAWRAANPEKAAKHKRYTKEERAAYNRQWRAKNPDREKLYRIRTRENGGREYRATYYAERKEELKSVRKVSYRRWAQANPHKIAAYAAKRRAALLRATPAWLTPDDHWLIDEIYDLCALRTRLTGVEHHVDHFYPLKGRTGCGLHVPSNLRVIPARTNLSKRNRFPTDYLPGSVPRESSERAPRLA